MHPLSDEQARAVRARFDLPSASPDETVPGFPARCQVAGVPLSPEQVRALRERFDLDCATAQKTGVKSSAYFLDKCGSEAGDFDFQLDREDLGNAGTPRVQRPVGGRQRGAVEAFFSDARAPKILMAGAVVIGVGAALGALLSIFVLG